MLSKEEAIKRLENDISGEYTITKTEALETVVLLEDYIEKDKIREELEELQNMKVEGEVFTTAVNFATKILKELLEGK